MTNKSQPILGTDIDRLKSLLPDGVNMREASWPHKQSGKNIILHRYVEMLAAHQKIRLVDMEIRVYEEIKTFLAKATFAYSDADGVEQMSIAWGEASPANNKTSYPVAMAEKRAYDRGVLKAVNLHAFFYSDAEMAADEAAHTIAPPPPPPPTTATASAKAVSEIADKIGTENDNATHGAWGADGLLKAPAKWTNRFLAAISAADLEALGRELKNSTDFAILTEGEKTQVREIYDQQIKRLNAGGRG